MGGGGGGGGHTESYRGYSPDCHLSNAGCLLTKRLTKGGQGHPRTPLATPMSFTYSVNKLVQVLNIGVHPQSKEGDQRYSWLCCQLGFVVKGSFHAQH